MDPIGKVVCGSEVVPDGEDVARARCVVTSEIERIVACGGFAAEFYLLNIGCAEQGRDPDRALVAPVRPDGADPIRIG